LALWLGHALAIATLAPAAAAKETVIDNFERASSPMPWTFYNGSEFPGAKGSLSAGAGHSGKGAHLAYDLSGGGRYVSATLALSTPVTATALAYWLKVPPGIYVKLRVVDSSGQTLQYEVSRPLEAFDANAWYREIVALDVPLSHYGGANDGVVHQPITSIVLMAADPPEPGPVGAFDFDDVVAIDALGPRIDPAAPVAFPPPKGVGTLASMNGVDIHFTKDDRALDLAKAAGFTFVRGDLGWTYVERTKGTYDFSAFDGLVTALAARGMGLLLILDYLNPLYPASDATDFLTVTVPAFAALSEAVAKHFAGKNVRFEVYNEPNLARFWAPKPDATRYGALCKAAIAGVHRGNAAALVSTGGISQFDFPFLRAYLAEGGGQEANAIGVHPYRQTGPESVSDGTLLMRSIVSAVVAWKPPVWSTEWGYSASWYGDGHAAAPRAKQASYAVREVLSTWAVGLPRNVMYDLRDDGVDATDMEANFGLLANDYSPKPAYTAMKTLSDFCAGKTFSGFLAATPSSVHALRLDSAGTASVVLWCDAPGEQIAVSVPAGTKAKDMLGADLPLAAKGTDLGFTLKEASGPVYLSLAVKSPSSGAGGGSGDADGGKASESGGSGGTEGGAESGDGGVAGDGSHENGGRDAGAMAHGGAAEGPDASAAGSGARGSLPDAGAKSPGAGEASGCGCSVPDRPDASTPFGVALGVVALLGARRRNPRARRR
jgi:MYXO-CTERM domain-containing protein